MAATKKSPLTQIKEQFKDKETLVDRVLGVVNLGDADREAMKQKLLAVSNKKLLRMLQLSAEIKDTFGSAEKLVQSVAQAAGKAKDTAYLQKLGKMAQKTPARVLDMARVAAHKAKKAAKASAKSA